jgi:hypothetical protein
MQMPSRSAQRIIRITPPESKNPRNGMLVEIKATDKNSLLRAPRICLAVMPPQITWSVPKSSDHFVFDASNRLISNHHLIWSRGFDLSANEIDRRLINPTDDGSDLSHGYSGTTPVLDPMPKFRTVPKWLAVGCVSGCLVIGTALLLRIPRRAWGFVILGIAVLMVIFNLTASLWLIQLAILSQWGLAVILIGLIARAFVMNFRNRLPGFTPDQEMSGSRFSANTNATAVKGLSS